MITDRPPSSPSLLAEYLASDRLQILALPQDTRLLAPAARIEQALEYESTSKAQEACTEFVFTAADFYAIARPQVLVLAARPRRVLSDGSSTELFGDYHLQKKLIRVWMRTAIRRQVTSFGTFFSTLCHEFCHHLDIERFGFCHTLHTRGFYARAAALYHHGRGTPLKQLYWVEMADGRFRIDWSRTKRGG